MAAVRSSFPNGYSPSDDNHQIRAPFAVEDDNFYFMSTQGLQAIWDASASQPFQPTIDKNSQFTLAAGLLLVAFFLSTLFGLNLSLKSLPIYAFPASLAFGFGAVYMICAVGVYV